MIKKSDLCYVESVVDDGCIYTVCHTPYGQVKISGLDFDEIGDKSYNALVDISEAFLMKFGTTMVHIGPFGTSCIKKKAIVEVNDG